MYKTLNFPTNRDTIKHGIRQTLNGRRLVLFIRRALFPPERRAVLMITYSELFLLLTLIVSIIALVVDITKKK